MRFLHTMLRVGNLQRAIDFYTNVLDMTLLRQSENPEYKYSLAFLGFDGGNPGQAEIELTYNYGVDKYEHGSAFGHLAISVPDAAAACAAIKASGGKVTRDWGNQIRSYVFYDNRVKDHRSGHEVGNPQSVLDGGLSPFIDAELKRRRAERG